MDQQKTKESVLVSVQYQGHFVQILIRRSCTIKELIVMMRKGKFIETEIPDQRLGYRKSNKQPLSFYNTIQDVIQNEQNSIHNIQVYIMQQKRPQSQVKKGEQFFKTQTNRILQRIVKYLKNGSVDSLLKARQNGRIQSTMAQHLISIGQQFQKYQRIGQFYEKSLQQIVCAKSKKQIQSEMQIIYEKYADFIVDSKLTLVRDIEVMKKNFIDETQQKGSKIIQTGAQLLAFQEQLAQKIQLMRNMETQNARLNSGITTLRMQLQVANRNLITNLKELQSIKIKQQQEKRSLQDFQTKIKVQYQKKVTSLENELLISKEYFQKELSEIQDRKKELEKSAKEFKQNSVEQRLKQLSKIIQNKQKSESQLIKFSLNGPIPGDLNEIIRNQKLTYQLRRNLQNQMKKSIRQVNELMSFNCLQHRGYSLKSNFQRYLHDKRSLLVVIRTQNDKVFGVFTEEKLTQQPLSYYLPDFDGCSFLFSLIGNEIKSFELIEGENSLLFDPDYLIFGFQDLMINFQASQCSSKFVQGNSINYNTDSKADSRQKNDYKFLLSDKNEQSVDILQYKIFEVKF